MSSSEIYDICVIGLGIAGLTACLYAARQGARVLAISKDIGGQLARVTYIENYPGTGPTSGFEIIRRVESQVRELGVEIVMDEVRKVSKEGDVFRILTSKGREVRSLAVIVASGKVPLTIGVEGEEKFLGRGVSYCVICDAALFRGKRVLYVSGNVPHLEMSLDTLLAHCSKVYWIPKGVSIDRKDDKLEILRGFDLLKIDGDDRVRRVVLRAPDGSTREVEVDGVFIELGYRVSIDFVRDLVQLDERGEIIVDTLCRTSCEGLFAAGDVTAVPYKQAIIAAGQGAIAALSACEYLSTKFGKKFRRIDWSKPKTHTFRISLRL